MLGTIGVFAVLIGSSIYDVRQKTIPLWILGAGGVWAVINSVVLAGQTGVPSALQTVAVGILPGAALLFLGFLTEKKVGYGDGLLLVIMGILEGGKAVLLTFCMGLFLQSVLAVVLVIIKKADKQTKIPFAPFLLAARTAVLFF
ncbi:MAG: prepilin peptidase [Lachnospiraceae bacterium]|nr:prepilin peptidase [Lachnospiraceae bacterium]